MQIAYDDAEPLPIRLARVAELVATHGRAENADLVVLPELWLVGAFRPRVWIERAETLAGPTVTAMREAARRSGAAVHLGSIIEKALDESGRTVLYNTAVVIGPDGTILTTYRKVHRYAAGGREKELLEAGDDAVVVDVPLRDGSTVRTGLATCYDLRFPELFRAMTRETEGRPTEGRAQLIVVAASFPMERLAQWRILLAARAVENQAVVLGCAASGHNGRQAMTGSSMVIAAPGDVLAEGGSEPFDEAVVCDVDLAQVGAYREAFPVLRDRRLG